jgi:hypothetical protein
VCVCVCVCVRACVCACVCLKHGHRQTQTVVKERVEMRSTVISHTGDTSFRSTPSTCYTHTHKHTHTYPHTITPVRRMCALVRDTGAITHHIYTPHRRTAQIPHDRVQGDAISVFRERVRACSRTHAHTHTHTHTHTCPTRLHKQYCN